MGSWSTLRQWWGEQTTPDVLYKWDRAAWLVADKVYKLTTWALAVGALKAIYVKTESPDIGFIAKWLGLLWMALATLSILAIMFRAVDLLPKYPQKGKVWVKALWYIFTPPLAAFISFLVYQGMISEVTRLFIVLVDTVAQGGAR